MCTNTILFYKFGKALEKTKEWTYTQNDILTRYFA